MGSAPPLSPVPFQRAGAEPATSRRGRAASPPRPVSGAGRASAWPPREVRVPVVRSRSKHAPDGGLDRADAALAGAPDHSGGQDGLGRSRSTGEAQGFLPPADVAAGLTV